MKDLTDEEVIEIIELVLVIDDKPEEYYCCPECGYTKEIANYYREQYKNEIQQWKMENE